MAKDTTSKTPKTNTVIQLSKAGHAHNTRSPETVEPILTDAVIIGAGPVGLFAVFQLGLLGLSTQVIDTLDKVGGQCAELYPEKPIYDIPAHPMIDGQVLVDRLIDQAQPFEPVFHLSQQAEHIAAQDDGRWLVTTSAGTTFDTANIVIAAGAGSFVPRRPPINGIAAFEERSVFYAVRDRAALAGHDLIIAGGGDSALDWALNLLPDARKLTLVHRRDEFRAAPDSVERFRAVVAQGRAKFVVGQITDLNGSDGVLESVSVKAADGGEVQIAAERLLAFYGLKTDLGPLAAWGLNLERNQIVVDTERFETNTPGIFAIGDINWYPGKLKLILSGFHEAALMAQAAFCRARPDDKLVFRYTTSSSELHKRLGVV